ncbi:MAG TPA: FHA domain-containing protein [Chitinivibrionales bacterium]|nr:FHA domain-containing protein [Chitinivibrionales bacterium]
MAETLATPSYVYPKTTGRITLGRDPSCNVPLKGIGSSRVHAVITIAGGHVTIEDCGSTFGTRVDGKPVAKAALADGSMIAAGVCKFKVQIDAQNIALVPVKDLERARDTPHQKETSAAVTIGRDPANAICLSHPLVSRFHATFTADGRGRFVIEDHGSTNGTFVNGGPVHTGHLDEGDIVQIGPYRFFLDNGTLQQAQDFNRITMEAFNLSVSRRNHTLISNISLSIEPGEFVAILGPSGAGKSTLAYALTGQIPLSGGSIFYNGLPMKKFCSAFNSAIGFVSQENLLRPELTVLETFTEQSTLRLPRDSVPAEHRERIREVMDMLDLSGLKNRRIADLSGGEAKRVHFGIELLSSPTVIFLDEPLAGLDPGLTHKFMELFRAICNKGHTILLTTHTLEQIELCNRLFFVSKGKLVFSGSPNEMRERFGTLALSNVYEKARSLQLDTMAAPTAGTRSDITYKMSGAGYAAARLYKPKTVSFVRQIFLLVSRYQKVLLRDTRTLGLMFMQAPLIAVLLALVFKHDSNFLPLSFYFCISISVIWIGGMNSVREIAREWPLIEREFRIGLSKAAYGISKMIVFCVMGAAQAMVFGACLHFLFANFSFNLSTGTLLCTACAAGSLLGLSISVFSRNVNMAISFLPIIFIPQIFFSGILMPFDEMPGAGTALSHLTVARPVFSLFKKMSFFDQSLWRLDDWLGLFLLCAGLIILLFTGIRFHRIVRGSGF